MKLKRHDEAVVAFEKTIGLAKTPRQRARSQLALAGIAELRDALQTARAHYREAISLLEGTLGPDHPDLVGPLRALGHLEQHGAPARAVELLARALEIAEHQGPLAPSFAGALLTYCEVLLDVGDRALASQMLERAEDLLADGSEQHREELWERTQQLRRQLARRH